MCISHQVDIHVMTQPPSGEWVHYATEVTNSHGRLSYTLPETSRLGQGIYPVKMVVRLVYFICSGGIPRSVCGVVLTLED